MNYRTFAHTVKDFPYFKPEMIAVLQGNKRTLQNELTLWQKQGKVHALRRGIYTLNEDDRRAVLPGFLISNILYTPSYVSLESALSHWGLIPEGVQQTTAVTVRKTAVFENFYGRFLYRTLKKEYFFGFGSFRLAGSLIYVAMPEKAVLDKIYLDEAFRPAEDYFLENLRLQNFENLKSTKILNFSKRFQSSKVREAAKILTGLIEKEKT